MFTVIRRDIEAILKRDPAVSSVLHVVLCYPGFHALMFYRLAHLLNKSGLKLIARVISIVSRFLTGVEIHPAAVIGEGVFIDHGMGVVIGETTEIGNNVTIYQGATLGGTGKDIGKRHPTICDNVVISAGAKVLGPISVGTNSKVGAGAVVLKEVPPNCTVVGVPGRIVKKNNVSIRLLKNEIDLDQVDLPDPIQEQIQYMVDRISFLENRLEEFENKLVDTAV